MDPPPRPLPSPPPKKSSMFFFENWSAFENYWGGGGLVFVLVTFYLDSITSMHLVSLQSPTTAQFTAKLAPGPTLVLSIIEGVHNTIYNSIYN